jgi:hypothetical protein
MNNSLINRNTTVLVLIILVLGFIFINLENNKSMTGGGVDCDLYVPIVKKLIEKDWLYSYTIGSWPGYIIYIILILILLYLGIAYAKYQVFFEGLNLPNSSPSGLTMLDLAKVGLNKFYIVRNDTYFYKNSPGSGTTAPADQEEFKNLVVELSTPAFKPTVNNFCEAIQPCKNITPCACKGSTNCNTNIVQKFNNVNIEHLTPTSTPDTAADNVLLDKALSMEYFFGIMPKCCCLYQEKFTLAAGTKAGQVNPNNKYKSKIPAVCDTGEKTASGVANSLNSSLVSAKGDTSGLGISNPEAECADVDCSNEPDYGIISIKAFDKQGNLTQEYAEISNNQIQNIVETTPFSVFETAYQGSSYNTPSNLKNESFMNSSLSKIQNLQSLFDKNKKTSSTPGMGSISATPGMSNFGKNSSPISNPLSDSLAKQLSKPFDPKKNLAAMLKSQTSKFTSDVPKNAKKIKKNKK